MDDTKYRVLTMTLLNENHPLGIKLGFCIKTSCYVHANLQTKEALCILAIIRA